jgi:hypothetical protein
MWEELIAGQGRKLSKIEQFAFATKFMNRGSLARLSGRQRLRDIRDTNQNSARAPARKCGVPNEYDLYFTLQR